MNRAIQLRTKKSIFSRRFSSKIFKSSEEAIADIPNSATVLFGGFGLCGIPENLIGAINRKGIKDLTIVSNDVGTEDFGLGLLTRDHQVSKVYASYVGENKKVTELYKKGEIELNLVPQGTLVEKLRAGGAGIPAFFTPTGSGTVVQEGKFPLKYSSSDPTIVEKYSTPKEVRVFNNNKNYLLEESLTGDFACIKAWKAGKHPS
jgi:3-oxoacid CoA-transferase